jgi:hypothetical protein
MITQQSQIKINLPLALKEFLETKANKYDITLTSYIKHLILNDVADLKYPTFEMSKESEKLAEETIKNKEKAIKINNVSDFFKQL